MSTQTNGPVRKSLAGQIDRLDGVIDALGDGLNEAVASAVQRAVGDAVREALQVVMAELLSNPELLARLHGAVPLAPSTPAQPPQKPDPDPVNPRLTTRLRGWVGDRLSAARRGCAGLWCRITELVGTRIGAVLGVVPGAWTLARPFRSQLLIAAGVGLVTALGVYFAGPYLAALSGWVGGFFSALGIQAGIALKRLCSGAEVSEA